MKLNLLNYIAIWRDNLLITFVWKIIACCIVPNLIFLLYFKNSKEFKYLWEKRWAIKKKSI